MRTPPPRALTSRTAALNLRSAPGGGGVALSGADLLPAPSLPSQDRRGLPVRAPASHPHQANGRTKWRRLSAWSCSWEPGDVQSLEGRGGFHSGWSFCPEAGFLRAWPGGRPHGGLPLVPGQRAGGGWVVGKGG